MGLITDIAVDKVYNRIIKLADYIICMDSYSGDPLHSRALAHSRAPLFTQPCPHCSHSRAPGEQWARLCVFTLQGCVQAARLCRGSPVSYSAMHINQSVSPSHDWTSPTIRPEMDCGVPLNTSKPGQNCGYLADDLCKCIVLIKNSGISI